MLDKVADHHTACQVMDLVEEEDLEEMAVILEGKDEILAAMSESLVDNKGEKLALRGGDQREPGQGDQRVNLVEHTLSRVGACGDGGGLCGKVEGPAEGQETRPMAVDLTKKVTQSLEQAKCNIDTKQGILKGELKTASTPLENAEKKGVEEEEEEEERKTSLVRGKRMPAWVRRESVQWEKEMIMVSSRRESRTSIIPSELLTSSRFQIQSLDCERLKEKDNKEEDGEVIKSSSISKMTKENEDGRSVSGASEIKPGASYKEEEGFSEMEETKGTTCCKEVEEEDFDFYKVEEKLTEWRRRRKSGREEDKDKDRVR